MRDVFAPLRDRLLRAGVRPKTVNRYLSELRDHVDDLTAELEAEGLSENAARERALSRLGGIETLTEPMISDRRFHSWTGKMPWAVFLIAPIVSYGAIVALLTCALILATSPIAPAWFGTAGWGTAQFAAYVAPLILAWMLAFMALRQRSRAMWPLIGMSLTIVAAAVIEIQVKFIDPQHGGEIAVALTTPSVVQIAALLLVAAAPLLLLRKHDQTASQV